MPVKVPFARANLAGTGEDIIWKGVMTRPAAKSQLTQPKAPMLSFLGRGKGGEAPEPSSQPMDTSEVSLANAERVTLRCEAILEGHGADEVGVARVWHCAWDPAGKTLATCSSDKTCRIWAKSAAAGNSWVTVAELEGVHSRTVRQAAWSPCGASLHGRHDDGCNQSFPPPDRPRRVFSRLT